MSDQSPAGAADALAAARLVLMIAWCTRVGPEDGGDAGPTYVVEGPGPLTAGSPAAPLGEAAAAPWLAAAPKPCYVTARWLSEGAPAVVVAVHLSAALPPEPADRLERHRWQAPEVLGARFADAFAPPGVGSDEVVLVVGGPGRVRCRRSALAAFGRDYRVLLPWSMSGGAPGDPWTVALPLAPAERAGVDYVFLVGRSRANGSSSWLAASPGAGPALGRTAAPVSNRDDR